MNTLKKSSNSTRYPERRERSPYCGRIFNITVGINRATARRSLTSFGMMWCFWSVCAICLVLTGCSRPTHVAVGYYAPGGGLNAQPISYISKDHGKTWMPSTTFPPFQGSGQRIVKKVSCVKNKCSAVGFYAPGGVGLPLRPISFFSSDGGKNWSYFVPVFQGTGESMLNSVSCTGHRCVAVGYYTVTGLYRPISYTSSNNGKTWTLSNTNPPYQSAGNNELVGVSCNGSHCSAIGYFIPSGGDFTPTSYSSHDSGKTWTLSNTVPPYKGTGSNILFSIDCTNNNCSTVGYYTPNGNLKPPAPISYYSLDGGDNWIVSSTLPPFKGPGKNILESVSCVDNHCAAIGYYSPVSEYHPISYTSHDNGKNWEISIIPPSYQGTGYNELMSIVCAKNVCNAVGSYAPGGNGTPLHPINYRSTDYGKNWSLSMTIPPYQGTGFSGLFGVTNED